MSKESRKLAKNRLDDSYEWPTFLVLILIFVLSFTAVSIMGIFSGHIIITPFDGDDTYIEFAEDFWELPEIIDDQIYKENDND